MKSPLHILALVAALLAAALIADSWLGAHRTATQLRATLDSQNALLAQAAAREQARDAALAAALARIEAEKRRVQTPRQAAEALPSVLPPLPLPVTIDLPDLAPSPRPPDAPPEPATVSVPQPDLKPLYDALADCRACALERDAAKKNLADEQARSAALIHERDAALAAARGGNFWSRFKHAAKWFAIGAVAGGAGALAARR